MPRNRVQHQKGLSADAFEQRYPDEAAAMANHASTRTTQLYDRRRDELTLDEVERITI
jgi:hypothetical protein